MSEKENFFKKYAHCADADVLEEIWQAKEGETKLHLKSQKISDLSPLTDLLNLQYLNFESTEVSDLSPLLPIIKKGIKVNWGIHDGTNGVLIWDCPLSSPPVSIAQQGNEAILRWFAEQQRIGTQKADILNQVVDILDDIHANTKYGNLRFEKLVPCPCPECSNRRSHKEEAEVFNYDFLLELLREGETESDRCRLSKRKFPIRDILKNAQVRIFKIEQIRDLIAADQIERALNLLRGKFDDDHEIIVQMSRLSELEKKQRLGQLSEGEYNVEKNRIRDAVLKTLTVLAT